MMVGLMRGREIAVPVSAMTIARPHQLAAKKQMLARSRYHKKVTASLMTKEKDNAFLFLVFF
jgi:hypothetical protein